MNRKCARIAASLLTALSLTISAPGGAWAHSAADSYETATPIKHLVVIFQENVSFDHYFATYPNAYNMTKGEPNFTPRENTPAVNNLLAAGLLADNPNSVQPFRLSRSESNTCDQGHSYTPEQQAADHGLMDNFVAATGSGDQTWPSTLPSASLIVNPFKSPVVAGGPFYPGQYYESSTTKMTYSGYCFDDGKGAGIVMGYYDGNTVTALWNYAQHFAMSDNSWDTNFGPSAPGAINVVSGNVYSATLEQGPNGTTPSSDPGTIWGGGATGALIGDARPYLDDCVYTNPQLSTTTVAQMNTNTGVPANVGDLMGDASFTPAQQITWGWFQGGFAPTTTSGGKAVCGSAGTGTYNFGGGLVSDDITTVGDYIPHHEPFQFYASTRNIHHAPPSSTATVGQTDGANHQYDLSWFFKALAAGNLPAVSYLKAPAYADGHPGYSDPLDEQVFIVNTINTIMASDEWKSTAIVIAYDDSDGWYDHQPSPIVNQSGETNGTDDVYSTPGFCGNVGLAIAEAQPGFQNGKCGYGTRQPLLVISPYARDNYVDHSTTDQSSIVRFIEDNWKLPRLGNGSNDAKAETLNNMFDFSLDLDRDGDRQLILNPGTGEILSLNGGSYDYGNGYGNGNGYGK